MREYKQFSPYKKARMVEKIEKVKQYYKDGYSVREIKDMKDIKMSRTWVGDIIRENEWSTGTDLTSIKK